MKEATLKDKYRQVVVQSKRKRAANDIAVRRNR
jgi:hypothetical protein